MKINLFIVTLIFTLIFGDCKKAGAVGEKCGIALDTSTEHRNVSILYIGNSHTYKNDLPGIVDSLAHSLGDSVFTIMSAPGGYNLRGHCILNSTLLSIKAKKWDYVVLQESGYWGAAPASIADTMVYPYASLLNTEIKTNNVSTEVILYMTHGYNIVTDWCNYYSDLCSYSSMQESVKRNYIHMSELFKAQVAPAGILWQIIMEKNPGMSLFADDNYHPNLKGSYISACAIFATIFHKDIRGAYYPSGLTQEDATLIQNAVAETLFNCNPEWKSY